jgi:glucose uptake protein GlcU
MNRLSKVLYATSIGTVLFGLLATLLGVANPSTAGALAEELIGSIFWAFGAGVGLSAFLAQGYIEKVTPAK